RGRSRCRLPDQDGYRAVAETRAAEQTVAVGEAQTVVTFWPGWIETSPEPTLEVSLESTLATSLKRALRPTSGSCRSPSLPWRGRGPDIPLCASRTLPEAREIESGGGLGSARRGRGSGRPGSRVARRRGLRAPCQVSPAHQGQRKAASRTPRATAAMRLR